MAYAEYQVTNCIMTDSTPDWISVADAGGVVMRISTDPLLDQARESFGVDHALFRATIGQTAYVLVDSAGLAHARELLPLLEPTNPGELGFDFQSIVRVRGKAADSGQLSLVRRAAKSWPEAARHESRLFAERLMSRLYQII